MLIILGYLFTLSGSRKLSGGSAGQYQQDQQYQKDLQYQQRDDRSDYDAGIRPEYFGEVRADTGSRSTVKSGGVVMIGQISIIFGSDRKSSEIAIILAIILMLLWFVLFR